MAAVHISSEPCALASDDRTRDVRLADHADHADHADLADLADLTDLAGLADLATQPAPAARQRAASHTSLLSATAAATPGSSHPPYRHRMLASSSRTPSSPGSGPAGSPRSTPSLSSLPSSPVLLSSSRPGKGSRRTTTTTTTTGTPGANAAGPSVPFPLFLSPVSNTTPETSLIGAQGNSIPLGDNIAAHRTSALRELNNTFPSPVFRHRATKSVGTNTTYSQPVIVKTYAGPSRSPSTSTQRRDLGRASSVPGFSTATSRSNATGLGWVLRDSLFNMGRSKGKTRSLIPWPWFLGAGDASHREEPKLPPLEAFSFKGIMADLQATTDIRSDLDRIAEICASSRYSLSNQYDAHVAPHGSGAAFVNAEGQPPVRPRGQRRGAAHFAGPTLQPSEDDDSMRGQRRRRGGIGGTRRRSAAYGTLETIMSSSRSSEEDKSKKKSANALIEEVRGRTSKTAKDANRPADEAESSRQPLTKGVTKLPAAWDSSGPEPNENDPGANLKPLPKRSGKAIRRQKPASFAHAVMDSSRFHRGQPGQGDIGSTRKSTMASSTATPALLSDLALPQTSDGLVAVCSPSDGGMHQRSQTGNAKIAAFPITLPAAGSNIPTNPDSDNVDAINEDDGGGGECAATAAPKDAAATGFLSGLSQWIVPWVAGSGLDLAYLSIQPTQNLTTVNQRTALPCIGSPSHAEGSLRELLKTVDACHKDKGKAVERDGCS